MEKARTILITGASSGLGHAFFTHYASLPTTKQIIAIDKTPFPSSSQSPPKNLDITVHTLDITNPTALAPVATFLLATNTRIDLLIHCAGVRGLVPEVVKEAKGEADDVAKAETWQVMNHATMMKTFEINSWGTFHLVQTFLPCLLLGGASSTPFQDVAQKPKVVIMTSRMGSLAANTTGGGYAYRASKAALNAMIRSFSIDVPQVQWLLLHPGRVETGLVGWMEPGAVSVGDSVKDCVAIIEGKGEGMYVDRFGVKIGW